MTALRIYGMNAIVLYVGAEFSFKVIFSKWQITHPNGFSGNLAGGYIAWWSEWTGSAVGAWVFVLTWLGLWWVVCWGCTGAASSSGSDGKPWMASFRGPAWAGAGHSASSSPVAIARATTTASTAVSSPCTVSGRGRRSGCGTRSNPGPAG
jgi:hypothetical protein